VHWGRHPPWAATTSIPVRPSPVGAEPDRKRLLRLVERETAIRQTPFALLTAREDALLGCGAGVKTTSFRRQSRAIRELLSRINHHPKTLGAFVALLAYSVTSFLILPRGADLLTGHFILGAPPDPSQYTWSLNWWPYAISHGLNPFLTRFVWAPQGFNLAWDATIPSLALISWPLTAVAGPVVAFNVLMVLAPIAAALSAYYLCYELTGNLAAATLGGWLFGFSSYEISQSQSHLNLNFTAVIPLVVWLAVLRFRGRLGRRTFIVCTSLLLTAEFGISIEVDATAALFAGGTLLSAALLVPESRTRIRVMSVEVLLAYAGAALLCAPYLWYLILGSDQQTSVIHSPLIYSTDLVNFFIPTPVTALGGSLALPIAANFSGNFGEDGAYLGLPLLLIVGLFAAIHHRGRWAPVVLTVIGAAAVATLGPRLHVLGGLGIPLPWELATKLPILRAALPARLTLYLALGRAVVAAMWAASARPRRLSVYVLAVFAVVMLWPASRPVLAVRPPLWISSHAYTKLFRQGATLVLLPYGDLGDSMLLQTMSGMYFRMAGGYTTATPKSFSDLPAVRMFFGAPLSREYGSAILEFCRTHRVVAIVVDRSLAPQWQGRLTALGWRQQSVGGTSIFSVPPRRS